MRKLMTFVLLIALFAGCKKDDDKDYGVIDEKIITDYLEANDIEAPRDPSGLYYKIIEQGMGTITPFNSVKATYKGSYINDEVFQEATSTFSLTQVIRGWQIGIPKIGKGGKILLFVPSALGYGSKGKGDVPANTVLLFNVEVKEVY